MRKNEKHSSMKKLLVSCALSVSMLASMGIGAFADGEPVNGTEALPASASITKEMQMPSGTTTPNGTVSFDFTRVSVDGAAGTEANMPAPSGISLSISGTDTGTTAGGTKTIIKETADLFANVTFPHAGTYVYTVKEAQSGFNMSAAETMEYSKAEYKVTVLVAANTAGTGLYIKQIAVVIVKDDTGAAAAEQKVTAGKTENGTGNNFRFVNKYVKHSSTGTSFILKKTVSGALGDQSKYFDFKLKIDQPEVVIPGLPATYTAVIKGSNGQTVTPATTGASNGVAMAANGDITVTPGTELTFKLKHNERIVFFSIPVGTSFTASETDPQGYTPSTSKFNDTNSSTPIVNENADHKSFNKTYIIENINYAIVNNELASQPLTGVLVNNTPYIVLILVVAAALAVYIAAKRRGRYV